MNFIDSKIEEYSISKSNVPSEKCEEIAAHTRENQPLHRMLIGPMEASILGFFIKSLDVKRVLEFGTFTGYSALAMAEQLPEDGEVITLDKNGKTAKVANEFWAKSEHGNKITQIQGHAAETIEKLEGKFDLVFIDADKSGYKNYLEKSLNLLSNKGIIIIDNVLWSGRVIDGFTDEVDKSTEYLKEINDFISSRSELYATLLPVRDGMFLVKKM